MVTYYGYPYGSTTVKCRHWRHPVKLTKEHSIYCSSDGGDKSATNETRSDIEPDVSIFLAATWLSDYGFWMTDGLASAPNITSGHPAVYLAWPDQKSIDIGLATEMVDWIEKLVKEGKKVEIACIGGHGRTGTLAALVMMRFNPELPPKEALEEFRKRYCANAIETREQEDMLWKFRGLEPPPPPPPKVTSVTSSSKKVGDKSITEFYGPPFCEELPWIYNKARDYWILTGGNLEWWLISETSAWSTMKHT